MVWGVGRGKGGDEKDATCDNGRYPNPTPVDPTAIRAWEFSGETETRSKKQENNKIHTHTHTHTHTMDANGKSKNLAQCLHAKVVPKHVDTYEIYACIHPQVRCHEPTNNPREKSDDRSIPARIE